MSYQPKCPRCDSRAVNERPGFLDGYEGVLETTHECSVCRFTFRVTPPDAFLTDERKDAPHV